MEIVGIGAEIIECLRIAQMIERHGELFINRVFTAAETRYCGSRAAATQHYASHWVAKEAVLKALGTGWAKGIGYRDIEIRREGRSQPTVALGGGAREACEALRIGRLLLTMSHCRTHGTPYALALAEAAPDDDDSLDDLFG